MRQGPVIVLGTQIELEIAINIVLNLSLRAIAIPPRSMSSDSFHGYISQQVLKKSICYSDFRAVDMVSNFQLLILHHISIST